MVKFTELFINEKIFKNKKIYIKKIKEIELKKSKKK